MILRKHYFKKLAKNGYLVREMSDIEIDKFAELKIDDETESECYPGQRRPKFKPKKRISINIDDIISNIDFTTKQTITEQNISLDNKKENYNTLPTKAKK